MKKLIEDLERISTNNSSIAENQRQVYETGLTIGRQEGLQEGREEFWDLYQKNGKRTAYSYAFGGQGWTDTTFTPKYSMKPSSANSIFYSSEITDLKGILESRGLTLDFSSCTGMTYLFNTSKITRVGVINTKSCSGLDYLLTNSSQLVSVDKVILKSDGSQTFQNLSFQNCTKLTEIRFEGVIGRKNFNMESSKNLSRASIESIIGCLSDTTSGISITLSLVAVDKAFETSEGANDGSESAEWLALKQEKPNWTVNLV